MHWKKIAKWYLVIGAGVAAYDLYANATSRNVQTAAADILLWPAAVYGLIAT